MTINHQAPPLSSTHLNTQNCQVSQLPGQPARLRVHNTNPHTMYRQTHRKEPPLIRPLLLQRLPLHPQMNFAPRQRILITTLVQRQPQVVRSRVRNLAQAYFALAQERARGQHAVHAVHLHGHAVQRGDVIKREQLVPVGGQRRFCDAAFLFHVALLPFPRYFRVRVHGVECLANGVVGYD